MQNKSYFLCFVCAVIIFIVCYQFWTAVNFDNIKYIKIVGQNIRIDLALTPAEHMQGLSGRSQLKEDESMFFVFDQLGRYPFWMKDMKFPIDIIWIGPDLRVIYIKKNAQPESYPETYGPDLDAKYVLEVVSGFSDKNNLKVGDRVEFIY